MKDSVFSVSIIIKDIIIIVSPIAAIYVLKSNKDELVTSEMKMRLSSLYLNVKISFLSDLSLFSATNFMLRRLFLAIITVFLIEDELIQILSFMVSSIMNLAFIIIV